MFARAFGILCCFCLISYHIPGSSWYTYHIMWDRWRTSCGWFRFTYLAGNSIFIIISAYHTVQFFARERGGGKAFDWVMISRMRPGYMVVDVVVQNPQRSIVYEYERKRVRRDSKICCCCCCCCCCRCRFCCGAPTTDERLHAPVLHRKNTRTRTPSQEYTHPYSIERVHAPVLHDASQIVYCRYWVRASLPPITSRHNFSRKGLREKDPDYAEIRANIDLWWDLDYAWKTNIVWLLFHYQRQGENVADMARDASTRNPQSFLLVSCRLPYVFRKRLVQSI